MKVFLIDGSALVYRAHFAMANRPLTTRHGEITNASYGSANAVLRLWEEEGCLLYTSDAADECVNV